MLYKSCPKCGVDQESEREKCKECGYTEKNNLAYALKIIGYAVLFIGIFGGFMLGMKYPLTSGYVSREKFNWIVFMICTFSSVTSGVLFLAYSEIIVAGQRIFELLRKY